VAFDVGGLSGAIESGKSGHLVPEGDIPAFAGAALNIITSPEARARLGARARERARGFSWRSAAEREAGVWKKLLRLRTGEPDNKESCRRVSPVSA
jgi:glycosyltransferase involved in cell wall biosynthesis